MSLIADGGHGPALVAVEAGGAAPECTRENIAAAEVAGRSGAAPETVGARRAVPEQGLKRAAPEQGMSDRPVKEAWVRSKM
jgi:hypothetical protein